MRSTKYIALILALLISVIAEGCHSSSVVSKLKADLNSNDESTRWAALLEINKNGPQATALRPEIIKALNDTNWRLRDSAILALSAIGLDQDDVPEVIGMLKDDNEYVRLSAADALGNAGGQALSAISSLEDLAKNDKSDNVRASAKRAIDKIKRA